MLRTADEELRRLRTTTDPDAGGLVVCVDCDHADAVARILQRITGTRPTVACSRLNDPDDPTESTPVCGSLRPRLLIAVRGLVVSDVLSNDPEALAQLTGSGAAR
jgi:hypothetical protein